MTSGSAAVHSDMLMWNKDDTNESVMYQLLATMFCVPQISIRFDNISKEHKILLEAYLKFWREHRDTLLDGEITLSGFDANFTVAKSKKDGQSVAVLYQNVPVCVENNTEYIFNSTGYNYIYLDSLCERKYILYDIFGNEYGKGELKSGVSKIALQNCCMVKVL